MTPARFDILYLLRRGMRRDAPRTGEGAPRVEQRDLRRLLGLSPTTISKMITRLEELGLVTRGRATTGDKRRNLVRLTDLGLQRIHEALGIVFNERPLVRSYDALVADRVAPRPRRGLKQRVLAELDTLLYRVARIARHHGDTSRMIYPFPYEPPELRAHLRQ
jgi:DNA-binding MarR family transcriptional regulator